MKTEKEKEKKNKIQVIYSFLPHECAEEDEIAVRNPQSEKNQHNMEEAEDIASPLCRISKPFGLWHLQTFVAYQVAEERRA